MELMLGSLLTDALELAGETTSWLDSRSAFVEQALRRLSEILPNDAAYFDEVGPHLGESSPPFMQRVLQNPQYYDPHYRRMMQLRARRPVFCGIDTEDYSARERERLPLYTELLRPEGISCTVCAGVQWGRRMTGVIFLLRYGRGTPFSADALEKAMPLLRFIGLAHFGLINLQQPTGPGVDMLSVREHEVAALVSSGYQNAQIAAKLGNSEHTVKRQLESIYRKTGLASRAELAVRFDRGQRDSRQLVLPPRFDENFRKIVAAGSLSV
jgi:DNA-binding CsgD family transcriptional regulator